jgi:hypothetical protein
LIYQGTAILAILVLLNNFLHDFSAAGWLFAATILYVLFRRVIEESVVDDKVLETLKIILLLMNFSFVGIVVFGIIRTMAYKNYEWSQMAGQSQITLLIVKHTILTVAFAFGLVYYIKARRLVRKATNEQTQ